MAKGAKMRIELKGVACLIWRRSAEACGIGNHDPSHAPDADRGGNDDTTLKILEFIGARAKEQTLEEEAEDDSAKQEVSKRRGLFTSGVVSTRDGRRIALFFSGRKHAGENLKDVLVRRAETLDNNICEQTLKRATCTARTLCFTRPAAVRTWATCS